MQTFLDAKSASDKFPRPESGPGHVLIVDDEEQNRTLLRDPLEAHGHTITEAVNGQQALEKVVAHAPDVILLDVMMPGMTGFEVCRRLKNNPASASIPVLMVTALTDRKERLMGIQAGANDFLNKPIDIQDISLRVGNAIYTKHLFDQLQIEREKSERLLVNILPKAIAERMKKGEVDIADKYPEVTVLVADLVGFTTLATHISPEQLVHLLNEIFSAFDVLVGKHGVEKIKTIGDAYMVAGGICSIHPNPAEAMVELALDMKQDLARFNEQYNTSMRIRIGIHTGPIVAGVIGRKKFAYDLWGETVNIACQLEALGPAGAIQVSSSTFDRLKTQYTCEEERSIETKGGRQVKARRLCERR